MPVIESLIDAHSPQFAQNREAMLAAIAQLRQLVGRKQSALVIDQQSHVAAQQGPDSGRSRACDSAP